MKWTILVVFLVLWLLGFVTGTTLGGLVHLLLLGAVLVVVFHLLRGRWRIS